MAGDAEVEGAERQVRDIEHPAEAHGGQPRARNHAPLVQLVAGDGRAGRRQDDNRAVARGAQGPVEGAAGACRGALQSGHGAHGRRAGHRHLHAPTRLEPIHRHTSQRSPTAPGQSRLRSNWRAVRFHLQGTFKSRQSMFQLLILHMFQAVSYYASQLSNSALDSL